jgi:hypothetical protein
MYCFPPRYHSRFAMTLRKPNSHCEKQGDEKQYKKNAAAS